MILKEIKDRTGELRAYSDETGKVHTIASIYKTDEDGNQTNEMIDGIEIIVMTAEEVQEVKAQVEAIEAQQALVQYKLDRVKEYPPIEDYLDGVVKGNQTQIQSYIDACLAVKAKYPKP
jgi:hypothetical protein